MRAGLPGLDHVVGNAEVEIHRHPHVGGFVAYALVELGDLGVGADIFADHGYTETAEARVKDRTHIDGPGADVGVIERLGNVFGVDAKIKAVRDAAGIGDPHRQVMGGNRAQVGEHLRSPGRHPLVENGAVFGPRHVSVIEVEDVNAYGAYASEVLEGGSALITNVGEPLHVGDRHVEVLNVHGRGRIGEYRGGVRVACGRQDAADARLARACGQLQKLKTGLPDPLKRGRFDTSVHVRLELPMGRMRRQKQDRCTGEQGIFFHLGYPR